MSDGLSFTIGLVDQMSGPAKGASGALSGLVGGLQSAAKGLNAIEPGLGSVVSALIGIQGAIAGTALGLIQTGLSLGAASASFKTDLTGSLEAALGSATAARDTFKQVMSLAHEYRSVSRQQIGSLAKELAASGLQGPGLSQALDAITQVQAALGSTAARKLQNVIEKSSASGLFKVAPAQLKASGITMQDLATAMHMSVTQLTMEMKHGQITAAQGQKAIEDIIAGGKIHKVAIEKANTLGAIWDNFKNNTIPDLFKGLNFKPLAMAFKDFLSIFDQTTASGKVMHGTIVGALQGLLNLATMALPYVKHGLEDIIIVALKVAIALKPTYEAVKQFLATHETQLITILKVLGVVVLVAAAGFAILAAIGIAFAAVAVLIVAAIGAIIGAVVAVIAWFAHLAAEVTMALKNMVDSGKSGATAFVQGLINGFEAGTGMIVDAVKAMGSAAIAGLKAALHIASPSQVMMEVGVNTAQGMALGVTKGSPQVTAAMQGLGAGRPGAPAGASAGARGVTITVEAGACVINGVQGAEQLMDVLPEALAQAIERIALQSGLGSAT